MSLLKDVRTALKDAGLPESSKALKASTFTGLTLKSLIKKYHLDYLAGTSDADELASDPEEVWHTFNESVIKPLKSNAVSFEFKTKSVTFAQQNLRHTLIKNFLNHEDVVTDSKDVLKYVDIDNYIKGQLTNGDIKVLAVQQFTDTVQVVFYYVQALLPTLTDIENLKALANKDNPTSEDKQAYSDLYQLIKKKYKANKHYIQQRELVEQERVLYSDEAREFVNLASILRVNF